MSKEVLSAFGFMNEKLTENNISTSQKNNEAYDNLSNQSDLNRQLNLRCLNKQAIQIKEYSRDFYAYLEGIKDKMKCRC